MDLLGGRTPARLDLIKVVVVEASEATAGLLKFLGYKVYPDRVMHLIIPLSAPHKPAPQLHAGTPAVGAPDAWMIGYTGSGSGLPS